MEPTFSSPWYLALTWQFSFVHPFITVSWNPDVRRLLGEALIQLVQHACFTFRRKLR